jgi:hypothetical protein
VKPRAAIVGLCLLSATVLLLAQPALSDVASRTIRFPLPAYWSRDEVRVVAEGVGSGLEVRWWSYMTGPSGATPWTLVGTYRSTSPDGEGWLPVLRNVPMLALARIYDPNNRNLPNGEPREIGHGGVHFTYDGQAHRLD